MSFPYAKKRRHPGLSHKEKMINLEKANKVGLTLDDEILDKKMQKITFYVNIN